MGKRYASNSCSFQNCKKNSLSDRIHLFRFPKDENRCQAWVDSCKNPKLAGVPAEKLNRSFRICCDHFNDWCFMNTTLKNSLVHNAIPNAPDPRVKIKIEKQEEDPAEASTTNNILLKSPCLLAHVHNAIPNAPDPRVKIKIEKQEEDPAEASTTNDILLKSPCLLAHLLQSPNSSQNTLIGNTSAYSDMLVKTSTTDSLYIECFPDLSPILNDQLSSPHVLPREVTVENTELHQTAPDSADKSTTRRRKYTPTKAKKLKHYKDSLRKRKLKSRFSNYKKKN